MAEFNVAVVSRPRIKIAGFKIATTMERAGQDCPRIWEEKFGPVMDSFPADPAYPNQSYGLSVMTGPDTFDYWAAMPIAESTPVPEGMESTYLEEGQFCECKLASLAELGPAFTYIYGDWAAKNGKYTVEMAKPGYELYTDEYMKNGSLAVYCPVTKK